MDPRVRKAAAIIRKNLHRDFSLGEIAIIFNLSASRLRHLFTYEMGITPARYLKTLRMQAAKELLETTFFNVRQIMLKVGIKDESHFVRDFKKVYGRGPSQHRAYYLGMKSSTGDSV
jgi:transcriptional regulator GlxA family with amidase domain